MQNNQTKFKKTEIGFIPNDWGLVKLNNACVKIQYGYTEIAEKENIGPKFLRGTDIKTGKINWGLVPHCVINENDFNKYKLDIGDIVITRMGSPGDSAIIENEINAVFASYLIRIKLSNEFIPKFVYYFLQSNQYKGYIKSLICACAQPGANAKQLTSSYLPKPEMIEQTQIAEILSSLDDKIELNRKMNETLEKIGQALFKHWFVDFEFPDENGKPYKSSGGKMVDSELGEIPEEWEKGKIKNILKIISGFAFSTKNYNREGKWGIVTIKNVQEGNFISECTDFILDLPIKMSADIILNKGDIVLSLTGNIGRACVVYGGKYLLNQRVAKIVSINKQNIAFCYFLLRQKNFQDLLISISKGVAQQNLSPVEMANLNIIIPGDNILKKFSLISSNIIEQIMKNLEENQILSQIRDSLLPRLMSGKLRVK